MRDDPRIEKCVADVLAGSGLPVNRRGEIAEELGYHLERSIADKHEAGLDDEQAVEAALAEFGSPEVIRKQLRRRQRVSDRLQAFAELRRRIWLPIAFAAFFAILSGVLTSHTNSLALRCLGALSLFTCLFVLTAGFMFVSSILEHQIKRQRPRSEHRFSRSCLRWTAVVTLGFVSLVPVLLVELAACAPLLDMAPPSSYFPLLLWRELGVVWLESPGRNFGLPALALLGIGLALALYERSRCVVTPLPRFARGE